MPYLELHGFGYPTTPFVVFCYTFSTLAYLLLHNFKLRLTANSDVRFMATVFVAHAVSLF